MFTILVRLPLILISSLFSIYILFDFFHKMFPPIYPSRAIYRISAVAAWAVFSFFNLQGILIWNLLFSVSVPWILAGLLFQVKGRKHYGMILLFVLFLILAEIVSGTALSLLFSEPFRTAPGNILADLTVFILYQIMLRALFLKHAGQKSYAPSPAFLAAPAASIILIGIIVNTMAAAMGQARLVSLTCVCIGIFLGNIYLYGLLDQLSALYEQKSQFLLLQQEKELQTKYYNELENKYTAYQQFAHDIRRHLAVLHGLYEDGNHPAASHYAELVEKMAAPPQMAVHTNNKIINILVTAKSEEAKKRNIAFEHHCEDTDLSFLEDTDLTILLSNLLDNAFEACMADTHRQHAVSLNICQINSFVVIQLSNTCPGAPVRDQKRFYSTKPGHSGIGMRNVAETVKKYNGSFWSEYKDHIFTVQATFSNI